MAPRRSSAQVTRDTAVDVGRLLIESNVTPHTLAVLIGQPASVITGWFVRGIRPPAKTMREATSTLKRLVEIRKSGAVSMSNTQSLRKALDSEPVEESMEVRYADFSPAPKNRNRGSMSYSLMNGKCFEVEGVTRAAFHRWKSSGYLLSEIPEGF